jgi:IS605 OrfB family transposase
MRSDRVFRKFEVRKRFYGEPRQRFGLAAQSAIRVIGKTVDAYTTLRANLRAGSYGSPGSTRYRLRTRLQAKGTSSARRLLKKRRRTEARFATDVNHQISKQVVAEAERTGRGIAVEDLTGIRTRVRLRKPQRATLHSWAFAQLGRFLRYKAELAGVAFVQVDPAYTLQEGHRCHWVDRKNRRSQAIFICGRCHFVGHADHNAAHIIAARGVVCWGEVMRPHAAPTLAASQGGSSNPIGRVSAHATGENVLVEQTAHHDDSVTPRSSSASRNARKA